MFEITRLATTATKVERKLIKCINKNNIDATSLKEPISDIFAISNKTFSKNPIKRAYIWCKDFVNNFKRIKTAFNEQKEALLDILKGDGKKTSNSTVKKNVFTDLKAALTTDVNAVKEFVKAHTPQKTKA